MISRRSILTGFAGLLAAPAIIKCSASLMPVKAFASGLVAGEQIYAGDFVYLDTTTGVLYRWSPAFPSRDEPIIVGIAPTTYAKDTAVDYDQVTRYGSAQLHRVF